MSVPTHTLVCYLPATISSSVTNPLLLEESGTAAMLPANCFVTEIWARQLTALTGSRFVTIGTTGNVTQYTGSVGISTTTLATQSVWVSNTGLGQSSLQTAPAAAIALIAQATVAGDVTAGSMEVIIKYRSYPLGLSS